MLIKHESFDVSTEKKSQKYRNETLYEPRHCPYIKYFLLPGLIGFMLLCILMNVNFDANTTKVIATGVEENGDIAAGKHDGVLSDPTGGSMNRLLPAASCVEDVPNCALTCSDGSLSHFDQDLAYLHSSGSCSNRELTLTFRNCEFISGIMQPEFFLGDYRLTALTIVNCNLVTIQMGAFQKSEVQYLLSLELIDNKINALESATFEGLKTLVNFKFLQEPLTGTNFIGSQFLKPMASTLQNATIKQKTDLNVPVNPRAWFQGTDLKTLYILDLSNNNLRGILDDETFPTLLALRELYLENCSLDFIDMAPFAKINNLNLLQLSNNHLKTLDTMFFDQILARAIVLNIHGNEWMCDCENKEMLHYLQVTETSPSLNLADFNCVEPAEWSGANMIDVGRNYEEESTTLAVTEISTTLPPDLIYLQCLTDNSSESSSSIPVKSNLVNFTIHTTSSTSVAISSSYFYGDLFIIYFHDNRQYRYASEKVQFMWQISQLKARETYIFCMVLEASDTTTISPFDCRGHYMVDTLSGIWLSTKDMTWSITVVIVLALHFCLLGMAVVYFSARKKPNWIFDPNPRVFSKKIVHLPKKSFAITRVSRISLESTLQERRVSYLEPERRPSDVSSHISNSLYASLHKPPKDMAPTIPPNLYRELPPIPLCPRVNSCNISELEYVENSPRHLEGLCHDIIDNLSNIYSDISADNFSKPKEDLPLHLSKICCSIEDDYGVIDHYEEIEF